MKSKKGRLYIAYGSNLNVEQMAHRCPTAEVVGTGILRNWRLMFHSVATVEPFHGGEVPVLVWRIQPQDEHALDRYEGWPHLYRKETLQITVGGHRVSAMIYIMNADSQSYAVPHNSYYETIRKGYESAGFDTGILDEAVAASGKGGFNHETDCKKADSKSP